MIDPAMVLKELGRVTRDIDLLGANNIKMRMALRKIVSLDDESISKARQIAGDAIRSID